MNPILVTPGNIGDHVAAQLADKGFRVRVLVREIREDSPWNNLGVEQVEGDFRDVESLATAFRGVDKLFSVSPAGESMVQYGLNAIEAARRSRVKYIVRSSGMGAATDSAVTAPRLHAQVEKALALSGIAHTVLRPNSFMQNYLGFSASIQAQDAFYLPQGDAKISLVDARDIAAIAVRALIEPGHEGKTYTITGPEAVSNAEIAEQMSSQLGRKISYVSVTDEQAAAAMRATGMSDWTIRVLIEFMQAARGGQLALVVDDAEKVLGRKPGNFAQFFEDHLAAFKSSCLNRRTIPTATA